MFHQNQLVGRYRVKKSVGSGGFGTVFLADDTWLKTQVALKVPHQQTASLEELLTEPRVLAALDHPEPRPVYHLAGMACPLERFFELVEELSGVPRPRFVLPYQPAWWLATAVERAGVWLRGEPPHLLPDPVVVEMAAHFWGAHSRYADTDLGYKSRDPRETLRDTIDWLRANDEKLRSRAASG